MSRHNEVRAWFRRGLTHSVVVLALSASCVAGLWVVYGEGLQTNATRLEAAQLASTEISEMVGTSHYETTSRPDPQVPLEALLETFGIPIVNPGRPLESMFPANTQHPQSPSGIQQTKVVPPTVHSIKTDPQKIALGWIPANVSTEESIQLIRDNAGINVVSPEWFALGSKDGTVIDKVQDSVTSFAHAHHVQVWGMVTNQYLASLAHGLLSNASAQDQFVSELANDATQHHLDGINVDFENMDTEDQSAFTHLIGVLHNRLSSRHIQLSVDITPDIVFLHDTDVYFHAGLAAKADKVIVMAYDEHWASDSTPGPVADVPWVTTAVVDLLNTGVPADKLILGIPFYARFWHVGYNGNVSSIAVSTSAVQNILVNHNASGTWNSTLQVNYARYPKPDGYEEVWYETSKTLQAKLALVNNLGLAGAAVWSLALSDPHTWSVLVRALRNTVS